MVPPNDSARYCGLSGIYFVAAGPTPMGGRGQIHDPGKEIPILTVFLGVEARVTIFTEGERNLYPVFSC